MVVLKEVKSMFWALFLEPGKRYSQKVEHPFHISMAALEIPTDHKAKQNEIVGVMVGVDKGEFLLSSLNYRNVYQQPVDLNFYEGEEVTFFLNGEGNVHLTGYVMDDEPGMDASLFSDEDIGESDEEMSDEDVPELVPIKSGKRKKEPKSTPTKKMKWIDDEAEEVSDEDSEADSNDLEFDDFYGEDDDDEDEEEESEDEKPKKKNKAQTKFEKTPKEKQKSQEENKKSAKKDKNKADVNSTPKTPASEPGAGGDASESSKKKKKKKKKNKEGQDVESTPQQAKVEQKTPQSKNKQKMKKQVLAGGTVMEEVHSGEGHVAKPGKMVHVYYVGKLQKNGKQFDSCTQGKPFRFRLGSSEVIKGWDAGLVGMKVGGKRKLVIPPQQAYGSQGVGGIPPNSTLVFEVELKNVS